jgi:hypothetical protein
LVEIVLIFTKVTPYGITLPLQHEIIKREDMTGNFVMLQMDDLRQVVTEIVEEVCTKCGLNEKPSEEEGEWLTREEVCDMLHITYTTLWRKENEGVIKKHKMGRRNLYSKKEVMDIFSSAIEDGDNNKKCKEECHG